VIYIGMDIHKNFIQACAMDSKGNVLKEQRMGTEETKEFIKLFKSYAIKAAIESTCNWYYVYDTLELLGVDTVLVNVRRTRVIAESKIKTDKLDAKTIAHCLRTGFIATSWIPPRKTRELRNIVRHRLSLRKEIARFKNKLHSIVLRNGIKHEYSDLFGRKGMEFLRNLELKGSDKYKLQSYLRILESLMEEKQRADNKISQLCKMDENAMLLTSIKGISYYSAMVIVSEIGNVKRFPNPKKLCSYAGLVPRTIQSGNHVYHGRIIKECNQNLKWILIQCTHVHMMCCMDSPVTKLYYRVMRKKGKSKAIVAASRKMLTIIWHMLTKGEEFKYKG